MKTFQRWFLIPLALGLVLGMGLFVAAVVEDARLEQAEIDRTNPAPVQGLWPQSPISSIELQERIELLDIDSANASAAIARLCWWAADHGYPGQECDDAIVPDLE